MFQIEDMENSHWSEDDRELKKTLFKKSHGCCHIYFISLPFTSLFHTAAAAAKGISEVDTPPVSQNGAPANKKTSAPLPELEYREKGKEGRGGGEAKKQHNSNSILPSSVDSKLQEMEYMENHMNNKRLTTELGSTENLLLKEDNNSSCSSSSSSSSKNYKNASSNAATLNSSPRGHSATNGSVPSSAPSSSSSTGKNEKKHKLAVGKGTSGGSHRDPTDNCIPNNQLSKPEALVR